MKAVAHVGARNNYAWHERYFPSDDGPRPGGPLTYCEYPANLVRIVNQFLIGVQPNVDGTVRIAPQLPEPCWTQGWRATLTVGAAALALQGDAGRLKGAWLDTQPRQLLLLPPRGASWSRGDFRPDAGSSVSENKAACDAPAGARVTFELRFS
jgi:hypothetical protein